MAKTKPNKSSYHFSTIEQKVKHFWEKYRLQSDTKKRHFSILMPPPNITGELHLGHALNNFIQDALIRSYRIKGYQTLWIPGFDHAGIATEILVQKWIKQNNLQVDNDQDLMGHFWQWSKAKRAAIHNQWQQLGLLIDNKWENFTLSPVFQKAVQKAFVQLYEDKLIYRAKKLINFDIKLQTALADIEVEHRQVEGQMYYIKYLKWPTSRELRKETRMKGFCNILPRPKEHLLVATTRPETIFADQALVIHPKDQRYRNHINNCFINPLTNKKLCLIQDEQVNPKMGTGVLKCTPGHDFVDFHIGKKHHLPIITCFNEQGILKPLCGIFAGKERLQARALIVEELEKKQLLIKTIKVQHQVPFSSKSNTVIEPYPSWQWFIKTQPFVKGLLAKKQQIRFLPIKYQTHFLHWMQKCEDWCISRQLKWGHQLPIYFNKQRQIKVALEKPLFGDWQQSSDVLDTWFSSALWSLVNFGWNNRKNQTLKKFMPINFLVTSYDIIFFWVAKMLFFHNYFERKIPFKKILIHGLIRTAKNEKMSKSKGNVINPLDLIDQFGVDGLRIYLLGNYKIGEDIKFETNKLVQASQFCNKLWNINQFLKQHSSDLKSFRRPRQWQSEINMWICQKLQCLIQTNNARWEKQLWSLSIQDNIDFIWKTFSNHYLEYAKIQIKNNIAKTETIKTMHFVWQQLLIMLHPIIPFLTEFIWQQYHPQQSILQTSVRQWKHSNNDKQLIFLPKLWKIIETMKQIDIKHHQPDRIIMVKIYSTDSTYYKETQERFNMFLKPHKSAIVEIKQSNKEEILCLVDKIQKPLSQTYIDNLYQRLANSNKLLQNPNFLKKAHPQIVQKEQEKKQKLEAEIQQIKATKK